MKHLLALLIAISFLRIAAQPVHLDSTYAVRMDTIFYSAPVNYRGCVDSLYMTRYIPVNGHANRPIVLLVHGGGFVGGTRHNPTNNTLGLKLAQRGYQTHSIDYRLGYHIPANINASFGCLIFNAIMNFPLDACMYPADTSEVLRALYRGSQDAKTAARFLKSRHAQDSTDRNRVFMIGESAGAFLSLQAAFLDRESEKPVSAGSLPNAPTPGVFQCAWNNPCGANNLQRPDLGSVRGIEHLGESDHLTGVISLLGGMPAPDIIATNDHFPRLFLHHQSCDPIVPYRRARVYAGLTQCMNDWTPGCFNCPALTPVPFVTGGKGIHEYITTNLSYPALVHPDFLERGVPISQWYGCSPGPNCGSLNPCPYCLNSQLHDCHSTFLNPSRLDSVYHFLYDAVLAVTAQDGPRFKVHPNPGPGHFHVELGEAMTATQLRVADIRGRVLHQETNAGSAFTLDLSALPSGIYLLQVWDQDGNMATRRVVKQ